MLMIILLALAAWLAKRALGSWLEAIPVGWGLLQIGLLVWHNAWLQTPGPWLWLLGAGWLGALLRTAPAPTPESHAGHPRKLLGALSLLCLVVAWLGQTLFHDDDYGAHGSIQGQLARGEFPLTNPWFPEIELHGHYGRDLLVVVWSRLTGLSLLSSQFLQTALVQALLPWLAYWALFAWNRNPKAAWWGTAFLTLGVRVGGRAGFLDTYQNNNPIAQLYWVLCLYLFVKSWRQPSWLTSLSFGIVLGGYAVVYETQFGLACLASLLSLGLSLLLRWHPRPKFLLLQGAVVLFTALILACSQGGPLTDLSQRFLSGKTAHSSLGHVAESQEVQLSWKRERLGQIRSSYDAKALVEDLSPQAWLYRFNRMQDPNRGYHYFWHPSILGLHHFPLFLAPWVLWDSLRQRDGLRLWLVAFGLLGFAVPAVLDFGPVFESEWFRWEYAAGLPLAGALGCTLGSRQNSSWWIALALLFCFSDASKAVLQICHQAAQRQALYAGAHNFFTTQPQFFCDEQDWQALAYLRRHSQPPERVLVNLPEEAVPNINFSATLIHFTGLHPLGNRKPFEDDLIGQWPFRLRADTRAFWHCGDVRLLEMRPVDWIYWRPDPEFYPSLPPRQLSGIAWQKIGQRWLGRVKHRQRWPWESSASAHNVSLELKLPQHSRGGQVYKVPYRIKGAISPSQGRLLLKIGDDAQDWLLVPIASQGSLPLAIPHRQGNWPLRCAWVDHQGAHPLPGTWQLSVDFPQQLGAMQLLSVESNSPRAGRWARLVSRWRSSVLAQEPHHSLRLALAAIREPQNQSGLEALRDGTGPGEAALLPQLSSQPGILRRVSSDEIQVEAWLLCPQAPGPYRVDWFFHPDYGTGLRRYGQVVEVRP